MTTIEEVQKCWKVGIVHQTPAQLTMAKVNGLIKHGIRKEQGKVWEYIVANFVWQWLIYSYMTHVFVRFWGDWNIMAVSLAFMVLYIPFTVVFIRKFRSIRMLKFGKPGFESQDIYSTLKAQRNVLSSFYSFKKGFDLISIPASGVVITLLLEKYGLIPIIRQHIVVAMIIFSITVAAFVIATVVDNSKRFKSPLKQLELVIQEIEGK